MSGTLYLVESLARRGLLLRTTRPGNRKTIHLELTEDAEEGFAYVRNALSRSHAHWQPGGSEPPGGPVVRAQAHQILPGIADGRGARVGDQGAALPGQQPGQDGRAGGGTVVLVVAHQGPAQRLPVRKAGQQSPPVPDLHGPARLHNGSGVLRQLQVDGLCSKTNNKGGVSYAATSLYPLPGPGQALRPDVRAGAGAVEADPAGGLATGRFVFEGFLPVNRGERRERLAQLAGEERTMIFYEAPHRLRATLDDLLSAFGDRPAALCRELTKLHDPEQHRQDADEPVDGHGDSL